MALILKAVSGCNRCVSLQTQISADASRYRRVSLQMRVIANVAEVHLTGKTRSSGRNCFFEACISCLIFEALPSKVC